VVDGIAYFGSALGASLRSTRPPERNSGRRRSAPTTLLPHRRAQWRGLYQRGRAFAFDAKTGAQLWSSSITDGTSSPAVAGGVVYCSGRVLARSMRRRAPYFGRHRRRPLSILGIRPPWQMASSISARLSRASTVIKRRALCAQGTYGQSCLVHAVASGSHPRGHRQWRRLCRSDDGTLYAFNAKTGAELAAVAGQSSPTVVNGMVYSETTVSGELFALGLGAGEVGRARAP